MRPPLPKNIERLAQQLDGSAFSDDMHFADRFAARKRALHMVENDHMTAALMIGLAGMAEKNT